MARTGRCLRMDTIGGGTIAIANKATLDAHQFPDSIQPSTSDLGGAQDEASFKALRSQSPYH